MKVKIAITDDNGKIYEGEIDFKTSRKVGDMSIEHVNSRKAFKKGSVSDNLNLLIEDGYFDQNRTIRDMIGELKSKDVHYKPADLTTSLRRFVRNGRLNKTKTLPDGTKSGRWTYIKK